MGKAFMISSLCLAKKECMLIWKGWRKHRMVFLWKPLWLKVPGNRTRPAGLTEAAVSTSKGAATYFFKREQIQDATDL